MMRIIVLVDYLGHFGSKYNAIPYRSGLDKEKFASFLSKFGVDVKFLKYSEINLREPAIETNIYIHDSIEDTGYYYKTYIEDIVYTLEILGAKTIPGFRYLRAHNNKVFMELLRDISSDTIIRNIGALHFGSREDFELNKVNINLPVVIKGAEDAQGRQVFLGSTEYAVRKNTSKVSKTRNYFNELKDLGRCYKHIDYKPESKYRKKFILQSYIGGLKNDWKILIFWDICYILRRGIPKGDFKASGSKYNYGFGTASKPPDGIFDFALSVYKLFNVPYISIDIAWDGNQFFALEYQFVSFGSSTHLKSDCYFKKVEGIWQPYENSLEIEYLYAYSINFYLLHLMDKGTLSL